MAVTLSSGITNDPASLYSAAIQSAYSTCTINFWHTIYGFGGSLNVSIYLNDDRKILIFRRDSNSQATDWTLASIKLGILFLNNRNKIKL